MTANERMLEVIRGLGGEIEESKLVVAMIEAKLIGAAPDRTTMVRRARARIRRFNDWCLETGRVNQSLIGFSVSKKTGKRSVNLY